MPRSAVTRLTFALLTAVLVGTQPCHGQSASPEQVAGQYMEALKLADWGRAAGLMHPSALAQLRAMLDPLLATSDPALAQAREQMFGVTSAAAAAVMPDSAVFAALLQFSMTQQPAVAAAMRSAEFRLLGMVREGADTVHVVGRIAMTVQDIPVTTMEVVSLMRAGDTWRGLLKGDMSAMASALRAAVERDQ